MAMIVLGSLLPWATVVTVFGSISISGTEGDGVITLFLGGVGLTGVVLALGRRRRAVIVTLTVAVLALLIAVYDIANIADIGGEELARVQIGLGLWLVLVGALLGIAFSAVSLRR